MTLFFTSNRLQRDKILQVGINSELGQAEEINFMNFSLTKDKNILERLTKDFDKL
jgi:hypothetical protein